MNLQNDNAARIITPMDERIAREIIAEVAEGRTLTSACLERLCYRAGFYKFIRANGGLESEYAQAQELRDERTEEEILEIADQQHDDSTWQRNRLDARYRVLAARRPNRWGPKLDLQITQKPDARLAEQRADARLMRLAAERVPQLIDGTALLLGNLADNQSAVPVLNPADDGIFGQ